MKIISFHNGSTRRVVIVYPFKLVFKFARYNLFDAMFNISRIFAFLIGGYIFQIKDKKMMFRHYFKYCLFGSYTRLAPMSIAYFCFRGLVANRIERKFYKNNKTNALLIPTYFSFLGLCNIQAFRGNTIPEFSISIYNKMFDRLSFAEVSRSGSHNWQDGNFVIMSDGSVALCDYASTKGHAMIIKYQKEISQILKPTPEA